MLAPLLAALVALGGVEPAQAAAPAPVSSVAAEALALAKLMAPRDLRIEGELKQFDANFSSALLKDKGVQEVEGKYPGTVDAMAKAVRPLLAEETGKIADRAYPKIAAILSSELSGPDIAELTAYYGSPAGRNLLRQLVESMDASSIYADALKNDGKVSEDAARHRDVHCRVQGDESAFGRRLSGAPHPEEKRRLAEARGNPAEDPEDPRRRDGFARSGI